MKIVYYTLMGNTKMLAEELEFETLELSPEGNDITVNEDFLIMIPSYGTGILEVVCDFLDFKDNVKHCRGILAIGEESYGAQYIQDAQELKKIYGLEIIMDFENDLSSELIEKITQKIKNI